MATVTHTTGKVIRVVGTPLGSEAISDLSTVKTLTVPAGAASALLQFTGAARLRAYSGDAPPASGNGLLMASGTTLLWDVDLAQLRIIEEAPGSSLYVEYFG